MEFIPFGSDEKIRLSVSIVQNMICIPTKSGKVCSEREAIKFMMLCKARALNPFEGDAFLQGYDGRNGAEFSLITAHQAFLKRAEPHPEFAGMRSGIVTSESVDCAVCKGTGERKSSAPCKACDEKGSTDEIVGDIIPVGATLIGGWATVFFKNRPHSMHKRVSLAVFKKPYGRWEIDPAGMIVKCAEADALRSSFPTKLGGLFLKEEQESVPRVREEVTAAIFGRTSIAPTVDIGPAEPPMIDLKPEATPESAPPKSPLANDRTVLADWMASHQLSWGDLQPVLNKDSKTFPFADSTGSFDELTLPQCALIYKHHAKLALEFEELPMT